MKNFNHVYCVVMGGGSGTRFWPRSTEKKPKQFLTVFGNESLIKITMKRFELFIKKENLYLVTKKNQREELQRHPLPLPPENIIFEPMGKNTLPCIGLSALLIRKVDPEALLIVAPADHIIQNEQRLRETLMLAIRLAEEKQGLITIGIPPKYPATGYGYIQIENEICNERGIHAFQTKKFVEKPNAAIAKRYFKNPSYLWNSGIFVFTLPVFFNALKKYAPNVYYALMRIEEAIGTPNYERVLHQVYAELESVSIDYGIMEKASEVYLVQGDFVWNDLGNWEQVYQLSSTDNDNNAQVGNVVWIDTKNSYVYSADGVVAVVGMSDVIVVQEGGATLVCHRKDAEKVKQVITRLKEQGLEKYQ